MLGSFNFAIDLPVRGDWANFDLLRTSVQSCVTAMFGELDGRHALAMVTGELIENAIKYGDWTGAEARQFHLRVWGEGRAVYVVVENPVRAGDRNADEVLRTLGWVRGFPSAIEAYRARLLEVAAADRDPSTSKLGLVRIAYEGDCKLTAELVGGVMRVRAELVI